MNNLVEFLDEFLSSNIVKNISIYNLLSRILGIFFVVLLYRFIFNIVKLIYLDLKSFDNEKNKYNTYLRFIGNREYLDFKINDYYHIKNIFKIGRSISNDLVLENKFVSKFHSKIEKIDNEYYIFDLSSSNGVRLNGNEIEGNEIITDLDIINIGGIEFLFRNIEEN